MKVVVFAGGKGKRLWPLSLPAYPKPLLRLGREYSFLQRTLLRFLGSYGASSLAVIAHVDHIEEVAKQCRALDPTEGIVCMGEKYNRGTCAAAALAFIAWQELGLDVEEPVLFSPSDGRIFPLDNFLEEISLAEKAAKEGFIVLLGVEPTHVELSYGYIEIEQSFDRLFHKKRFIEKPSRELAEDLLKSGKVLWNTGHVLLTAKTFWQELEKYVPQMASLQHMSYAQAIEEVKDREELSLDHAILEHSSRVCVSCLQVTWSDMGSWDRVYQAMEKNADGNVTIGSSADVSSKNCLFFSEDIPLITLGLDHLVVIATRGGVLVAKQESLPLLKQVMQEELPCSL